MFQFGVDHGVFFDVLVGLGEVGFRLVVIVIGDEEFDAVFGEEFFEFVVELGGEGFVVGDHEGGFLDVLDDVCDGKGFAGAGDAQESLGGVGGLQVMG